MYESIPSLIGDQKYWELNEDQVESPDGVMMTLYDDYVICTSGSERAACQQHLNADRDKVLLQEFLAKRCRFPESSDEAKMVRVRFICDGPVGDACGLWVAQYDREGNRIAGSPVGE